MKLSDKEYELIQKFVSGGLSEADRLSLKDALKNEAFRKELEFQTRVIDTMEDAEGILLIEQLKKSSRRSTNVFRLSSPVLRIAAIGILLIASWFAMRTILFPSNISTLVEQHNVIYPPDDFQRGDGVQLSRKYKEAMSYYANENFALANNMFLDLKVQTDKIKLYRANCLIEMNKHEEAKTILQELILSEDEEIVYNAQWYSSISFLLGGKKKEAIQLLKEISSDDSHLFATKARQLLEDL